MMHIRWVGAFGEKCGQMQCKTKLHLQVGSDSLVSKRTIFFFLGSGGVDAEYWAGYAPWAGTEG